MEKKEPEIKILDDKEVNIIIPQCCREGWENCPHAVKRQKPAKKNIGL